MAGERLLTLDLAAVTDEILLALLGHEDGHVHSLAWDELIHRGYTPQSIGAAIDGEV